MMKANWNWKLWVSLLLVATLVGCGQKANRPKTVPVSGTVTYNGKPVQGAVVTFNPTDRKVGKTAIATTDASGKYTLMTFEQGDGAIPGTYKVTISKVDTSKSSASAADAGSATEENPGAAYAAAAAAGEDVMAGGTGATETKTKSKDLLPKRYKNPEASGLIANVSEGGSNTFDFKLTD